MIFDKDALRKALIETIEELGSVVTDKLFTHIQINRQLHPKPKGICGAEDSGFYCTLAPKHVDDHEAYEEEGTDLLHSWSQD